MRLKSIWLCKENSGIPKLYWFGTEGDYNILVIQIWGPSLELLRKFCKGRFSINTTTLLTIQMFERIRAFHDQGLLHRDIKPDNFLIGLKKESKILFLVDYGLVKAYRQKFTRKHIPFRKDKGVTGTVRYSSINTHWGYESSRRDEIESIWYVAVFLFNGRLPWQNTKKEFKSRQALSDFIKEYKEGIEPKNLWNGMPKEYSKILGYSRSLEFEDKPDYSQILTLLMKVKVK